MEIVAAFYTVIYSVNHNVVCNTFEKTESRGKGTFNYIRRIYVDFITIQAVHCHKFKKNHKPKHCYPKANQIWTQIRIFRGVRVTNLRQLLERIKAPASVLAQFLIRRD